MKFLQNKKLVYAFTSFFVVIAAAFAVHAAFSDPQLDCVPGTCPKDYIDGARVINGSIPPYAIMRGQGKDVVQTKVISSAENRYLSTCALLSDNTMKCWGYNGNNELGLGNQTTNRWHPVYVPLTKVKEIVSGGYNHNCAIRTDNSLWCWGLNSNGQIGDGTTTNAYVPKQILTDVKSTMLGNNYTCAIRTDNTLWCWGYNGYGNLGVGDTVNRQSPQKVNLANVQSVYTKTGSYNYTCAIAGTTPKIYCWGYNGYGQLGEGSTTNQTVPAVINEVSGPTRIILGSNNEYGTSCSLNTSGEVHCWGYNGWGQVGDGTTTNRNRPVKVSVPYAYDIASVGRTVCALTETNAYCWGQNGSGQVGNGTTTNQSTPAQVSGVSDATLGVSGKIRLIGYAGSTTGCVVMPDKTVKCWGYNGNGEVGDGTTTNVNAAKTVQGLSAVENLYGFGDDSSSWWCALTTAGKFACWGYNAHGQMGIGNNAGGYRPTPQFVRYLND